MLIFITDRINRIKWQKQFCPIVFILKFYTEKFTKMHLKLVFNGQINKILDIISL